MVVGGIAAGKRRSRKGGGDPVREPPTLAGLPRRLVGNCCALPFEHTLMDGSEWSNVGKGKRGLKGRRVRGRNMEGGEGVEEVRDANKQRHCVINQSVEDGWRL